MGLRKATKNVVGIISVVIEDRTGYLQNTRQKGCSQDKIVRCPNALHLTFGIIKHIPAVTH
jgi:hypothetical protein